MIDPLLRGIYYMYLLSFGWPDLIIRDKETSDIIKYILLENELSAFSSVQDIRGILLKELLR